MGKGLTKRDAAVLALIVSVLFLTVLGTLAAGTAAAQETTTSTATTTPASTPATTETPASTTTATQTTTPAKTPASTGSDTAGDDRVNKTTATETLYQLEDVDIRDVRFVNGTAVATVYYHNFATVSITDSGAVKGLGSNSGTGVQFNRYTHREGEHTLKLQLRSDDELVTIQQGDRMYAASGDRAVLDILSTAPTVDVVRWSALSGGIGTLVSLALVVGYLRRRHENTYKELLSEERVRVEEDTVDGVIGTVTRFISRHRYVLLLAAAVVAYLTAVAAGVLPSPGEIWSGLTDSQRVLVTGSSIMTVIMFIPVYVLASRLWEPAKEFVIDIDARDVLEPSLGSNSGLALNADSDDIEDVADELDKLDDLNVVAVYSGSPDRVSKMRADGKPAEIRTPGGKAYLVEEFDPRKNVGIGTWPGTANDVELISERSKIDGNREILRDESRMLRTLIGAMPAIATASDTDAMRSVDKEIRELSSVNSDPIDSLLNRAASGTRFEGMYSDEEEKPGYDQLVNDDDDDENEDGEDGDDDGVLGGVLP
jgi:hypothetical protein